MFPPPPEGSFPVVEFTPPMPLTLYGVLTRAIAEACEAEGFEAFFREEDGLGKVWVRKAQA